MILAERIEIRNLTCFQDEAFERMLLCQWTAKPPVWLYEVVFTRENGSEIIRQNVRSARTVVELDDSAGKIVTVSVGNVSSKIELRGTSANCLHTLNRSNPPLLTLVSSLRINSLKEVR